MPKTLNADPPGKVTPKNRIKNATPTEHGLYPHEILALDYAHTYYPSSSDFQGWWLYTHGVEDVRGVLSSLEERGFIEEDNDLYTLLEMQDGSKIREILIANGSKVSGTRETVLERVLEEVPEDELIRQFPEFPYRLTEVGKSALDEAPYIPYIARNALTEFDIWTVSELINTPPYMLWWNKICDFYIEQRQKHIINRDFGLYNNCSRDFIRILKHKNMSNSILEVLAEMVFYILRGCTWNSSIPLYLNELFPYERSCAKISQYEIVQVTRCQEEIGYSDEELKVFFQDHMKSIDAPDPIQTDSLESHILLDNGIIAPVQLFSIDECVDIFFLERNKDISRLEEMYQNAEEAFKQRYPKVCENKFLMGILSDEDVDLSSLIGEL